MNKEKIMTDKDWIKLFPEAIDNYIVPKIAELERTKVELEKKIKKWLWIIRTKSKPENWWFWEMRLKFFEIENLIETEKQIKHFKNLLTLTLPQEQDILQDRKLNKINENTIREVEEKPLEHIIGTEIKLRKSGKNLVGLCPFHKEKTPSFFIFTDKNRYKCFGCGEYGNSINFAMKYYNLSFRDAVDFLLKY